MHYAITTLIGGSVDSLSPQASLAIALSDAARLGGLLVVLIILATVFLNPRPTKQDEALRNSVECFRRRGHEFENGFMEQYEMTVADAIAKLKRLGYGLVRIITLLSAQIPPGFEPRSEGQW